MPVPSMKCHLFRCQRDIYCSEPTCGHKKTRPHTHTKQPHHQHWPTRFSGGHKTIQAAQKLLKDVTERRSGTTGQQNFGGDVRTVRPRGEAASPPSEATLPYYHKRTLIILHYVKLHTCVELSQNCLIFRQQ